MHTVKWDIQYISPPPVIKYCKKCGKKTEYICSGLFRVNSQRKYIDIWLIYKCSDCQSTWNMTIFSRISPKSIDPELLEEFQTNNKDLAMKYAMDTTLINKNGGEAGLPDYKILGPAVNFTFPVKLQINSPYPSRLKVSALLREHMNLSQSTFEQMVVNGSIQSPCGLDIKKCRVQTENNLIIKESQTTHVQEWNRKQCQN